MSTVADRAAQRVTRKAIRELQRMTVLLSGEDSELQTTWDEICVQVHDEESFHWDSYDHLVRSVVQDCVGKLPKHERDAIWLQTDAGIDWSCEEPADRNPDPDCEDDIPRWTVKTGH